MSRAASRSAHSAHGKSHTRRTPASQITPTASTRPHARSVTHALWQRIVNTSAPTRVVILILLVATALRLLALGAPSTEYDEGVYWQSLRAMVSGHALFSSVFSSQPPFFLLSVYPFYALLGQTLFAARLGIAVYSLFGVIAMYVAGRLIAGGWGGALACTLLAFDPVYLKESTTLQAEAPSLAFAIMAVALAAWAMRRMSLAKTPAAEKNTTHDIAQAGAFHRWAFSPMALLAALSGVALALGVLIKLWDVLALLPVALYLLALSSSRPPTPQTQHETLPTRETFSMRVLAAGPAFFGACVVGALLAALAVLLPFRASFAQMYAQVVSFHTSARQSEQHGVPYNLNDILHDNIYLTGAAALLALGLALWRCYARDRVARRPLLALRMAPPALWALASFVFLLLQHPLFPHHVTLLIPPLALMASLAVPLATGVDPLARPATQSRRHANRRRAATTEAATATPATPGQTRLAWGAAGILSLLVVISLGFGVVADQTASQPLPTESQVIVKALQTFTLPGDLVAGDDQYLVAYANRSTPPQLVDTSSVRIESGYLTASQVEGIILKSDTRYILFASGRFALIPGFSDWVQANCQLLANFGHGRALWLRQPSGPVLA